MASLTQALDSTEEHRSQPPLQRAARLFSMEERPSDSPFVDRIWHTYSEPAESFISVAATHSQLVVTRQADRTYVTLRGPETKATAVPIPQAAEFWGIEFKLGTFMPHLTPDKLVDGALTLPDTPEHSFRLDGSAWCIPTYENADAFLKWLVREGVLVRDPIVEEALVGRARDVSSRSVQRRVLRATGLTQRTIRQIERARRATSLLDQGVSILDAVEQAGYVDQAHMTKALKHFMGQTPAEVARSFCRN